MTDKPDALLPCPFCGGEAEFQTDKGPTGELYGWVGCDQCDAMSPHCDIRSMQPEELHPIDAWNTRQPPAPQDDEDELGDGSDYGITPIPKSDAGEAVGEPAASAPPASGAVGDDLVAEVSMALCQSALGGRICPCREVGTFACENDYPAEQGRAAVKAMAPIIAERDAALAECAFLYEQIDDLANYILAEVEGEPSENQGAVDTAIRIMRSQQAKLAAAEAREGVLREALEKLARLGNGDHYGNSDGNMIARAALATEKKP